MRLCSYFFFCSFRIDEALGYKVGTGNGEDLLHLIGVIGLFVNEWFVVLFSEKVNENQGGRTNVVHRLSKLEKQVCCIIFFKPRQRELLIHV